VAQSADDALYRIDIRSLGALAALLVAPSMATFLAGLSPADPIAFAAAAAVLMVIALAASYIPPRRVARVDPLTALRQ
jgi:ABC-type antimicrobial peptide transport system permease subunit